MGCKDVDVILIGPDVRKFLGDGAEQQLGPGAALTGALTRDTKFAGGEQSADNSPIPRSATGRCLDAIKKMRPIAAKYGRTFAQLAIYWVTDGPA